MSYSAAPAFALSAALLATAAAEPVPLVCAYDGGRTVTADGRWQDLSGNEAHAKPVGNGIEVDAPLLRNLSLDFSVTAQIKVESLPQGGGNHWLFGKGANAGWQVGLQKDGRLWWHGSWGGGWYHGPFSTRAVPVGEWVHVALTFQRGGRAHVYVDGVQFLSGPTAHPLQPVDDPFQVGRLGGKVAVGAVRVYAQALTKEQVMADQQNALETRPATAADLPEPPWSMRLTLGRFDRPKPNAGYVYPVKQPAERRPGPHAVDWPRLRLSDGQALFADPNAPRAEQWIDMRLMDGGPWFRAPDDPVIEPVGHWFRALNWRWGQQHVYTTDRTARSWGGEYELWGFPLLIAGEAPGTVRRVLLRMGDETLYQHDGPLDSLTLLLPANLGGKPYMLSVNDALAQTFDVRLKPILVGRPADELEAVELRFAEGIVAKLPAPHEFSQQKEWQEDVAALDASPTGGAAAAPSAPSEQAALPAFDRSPVTTFLAAMSAGMSGGLKTGAGHIERFEGDDDAYGRHIAALGMDRVFETANPRSDAARLDAMAAGIRAHGVRFGVNLSGHSHESQLGSPNIAFYAAYLPDWGDNLVRDLQLAAQRWGGPSGGGVFMGADNAGYVPYWDWAPPIPNRPWGRALVAMTGDPVPQYPIGPQCGPLKSYERRGTQREFVGHIRAYDRTWSNYGRFARTVAEIAPDLPFTIGSFGSSPGVGGRGGWPWASVPGGLIYDGFEVQTAYDWNELLGSKPLHNLALVDRLRSAAPERATWSIVDDFGLNRMPQTLLRDWAVVLSRGLHGIGSNFLAHDTGIKHGAQVGDRGPAATPASVADVSKLSGDDKRGLRREQMRGYQVATAWAHRFGGAYTQMRSSATVGIVFSDLQAVSRHLDTPDPEGPHEGKTTEALLLCSMAGWPARLVTVEELARGIDPQIEALLLVGLNRFDDSWIWHEGLEPRLEAFVARGGRVLLDHESVAPVPGIATGLRIAAFVKQTSPDPLPLLQHRNRPLVPILRQHLAGVSRGVVASDTDTVWVFPSEAGDCLFATVANFTPAPLDGAEPPRVHGPKDEATVALLQSFRNACREVLPVAETLVLGTDRAGYDLAAGRPMDVGAAVDPAGTAVRLLVFPKEAPTAPIVEFADDGLRVTMPGCAGLPVEAVFTAGDRTIAVWGAAGGTLPLPAALRDGGEWAFVCRELATGLETRGRVPSLSRTAPMADSGPGSALAGGGSAPASAAQRRALAAFAERRDRELVIALTERQGGDPAMLALAERLRAHYAAAGRAVRIGRADPTDVVLHQQPIQPLLRAPRWHTIPADLILLGTPTENVLLLDQQRAGLLPAVVDAPRVVHSWSPFRGGCHVVNLLGADRDMLGRAGVELTSLGQ